MEIRNRGEAIDHLTTRFPGQEVVILQELHVNLIALRSMHKAWLFQTENRGLEQELNHFLIDNGIVIETTPSKGLNTAFNEQMGFSATANLPEESDD